MSDHGERETGFWTGLPHSIRPTGWRYLGGGLAGGRQRYSGGLAFASVMRGLTHKKKVRRKRRDTSEKKYPALLPAMRPAKGTRNGFRRPHVLCIYKQRQCQAEKMEKGSLFCYIKNYY